MNKRSAAARFRKWVKACGISRRVELRYGDPGRGAEARLIERQGKTSAVVLVREERLQQLRERFDDDVVHELLHIVVEDLEDWIDGLPVGLAATGHRLMEIVIERIASILVRGMGPVVG